MSYSVHSKFARDFDAMATKIESHRAAYVSSRFVLRLILPIAYFGLLISPAFVCAWPFQILRWCSVEPPSFGYWFVAAIVSALILFVVYRLSRLVIWQFRQHLIDLESVVGLAGFMLSVALTAYILPRGWF